MANYWRLKTWTWTFKIVKSLFVDYENKKYSQITLLKISVAIIMQFPLSNSTFRERWAVGLSEHHELKKLENFMVSIAIINQGIHYLLAF